MNREYQKVSDGLIFALLLLVLLPVPLPSSLVIRFEERKFPGPVRGGVSALLYTGFAVKSECNEPASRECSVAFSSFFISLVVYIE